MAEPYDAFDVPVLPVEILSVCPALVGKNPLVMVSLRTQLGVNYAAQNFGFTPEQAQRLRGDIERIFTTSELFVTAPATRDDDEPPEGEPPDRPRKARRPRRPS